MPRAALLTGGSITVAALLVFASVAPANAVDPGDGAVLYNPDLTPIGSELSYGGIPQYEFTTATNDDDYWGLDAQGEPANEDGDFDAIVAGIPLGFTVVLGGVSYDGAVVNSNGTVCLTSSTDSTASVTDGGFECWFYAMPPAHAVGDEYYVPGLSMAVFSSVGVDQIPGDDFPIDTDADMVNDACEYGGFYVVSQDACTSVFWGTTTYDGRPAFAATWYFAPDYNDAEDTNVVQLLLVGDGDGNMTVVSNVDRFLNYGYDLSYWEGESGFEACSAAYDDGNGDLAPYIGMGAAFRTHDGTTGFIDLFGPECAGGLNPVTADLLIDGASSALNENSVNSTQSGRYVFYVRDGVITADPAQDPIVPAAPTLPDTGADAAAAGAIALLLLAAGAMTFGLQRRARA